MSTQTDEGKEWRTARRAEQMLRNRRCSPCSARFTLAPANFENIFKIFNGGGLVQLMTLLFDDEGRPGGRPKTQRHSHCVCVLWSLLIFYFLLHLKHHHNDGAASSHMILRFPPTHFDNFCLCIARGTLDGRATMYGGLGLECIAVKDASLKPTILYGAWSVDENLQSLVASRIRCKSCDISFFFILHFWKIHKKYANVCLGLLPINCWKWFSLSLSAK